VERQEQPLLRPTLPGKSQQPVARPIEGALECLWNLNLTWKKEVAVILFAVAKSLRMLRLDPPRTTPDPFPSSDPNFLLEPPQGCH
jgi:hypothetical protein